MKPKFVYQAGDLAPSQCVLCRRRTSVATCSAYPGGIPDAIRMNARDHREPQPGDGGLGFQPAEGVAPEALQRLADHFGRPES